MLYLSIKNKLNGKIAYYLSKIANIENGLIDYKWFFKVKTRLFFSKKVKVGFGPITSGEDDLAERKWRIDPIINNVNNRKNGKYAAGFFVHPQEMKNFDVIIIVKKFTDEFIPVIQHLKIKNKLFIYDIVDNPNSEKKYGIYFADNADFSRLMDGFIVSSPIQKRDVKIFSDMQVLIEHPVISPLHKTEYPAENEVTIIAHGYYENVKNIKMLEPIIREISCELNMIIKLVYHCEVEIENTEWVRYVKWTVDNCFTQLLNADIAIVIKNLHLRHQRDKPSTKLITFMAAGLSVICTPSAADQLVMQNGITGFYAYTLDDWKRYIKVLASNPKRRKQIGQAARNSAHPHYSVTAITDKYLHFIDQIRVANHG